MDVVLRCSDNGVIQKELKYLELKMPLPKDYPKRILLAGTGLSPQIVTETLYSLAVECVPAWIPTEIHVITTRRGADNVRLSLLSDEPGWLRRLREDYGLPEITFGEENIHVITGPDGEALDDVLSVRDNVAAADFITEQMRALTDDPESSLHVTIAGGRKTMGFYIGYALSLFGRPQDRLSHVLVSAPFESLREFFYPSPASRLIHDRHNQPLNARDGHVYLGEIPFVRLRDGLPTRFLEGHVAFSETVAEAQKALPRLFLRLDPRKSEVVAAGRAFSLEPLQFAFYWMMADRCRTGQGGVHRKDSGIGPILQGYRGRLDGNPRDGKQAKKAKRVFDIDDFDQTKAKVNRTLKREIGDKLAEPYLIARVRKISRKGTHQFGLSLPPGAITIVES